MSTTKTHVTSGGTGDTDLTAHGVLIGEGIDPVSVVTPGVSGTVLTSNGASADPSFQAVPTPTVNANSLTGTTLASGVVSSSLTSVGTLTNLTVTNAIFGAVTGNAATVTNGVVTTGSYSDPSWITGLAGSKVSGNISGNAANVTGTVAIGSGGTGQTTANAALNALLPSQSTNENKVLQTDGTNTSWATAGGGSGTVTSVATGTGLTGGPITTAGTVSLAVPVSLANGGTNANLSATGGAGVVVKQKTTGGPFVPEALVAGDIPSGFAHDPLGELTGTVNAPIPVSVVDVATNGTTWVLATGSNKIFTTTDPTDTSKWSGHISGTPGLVSICRMSGVGFVGVWAASSPNVWINANEDGVSWVNQAVTLPFIPACIRTDGTTIVVCGTSAAHPFNTTAAGQIWTSTDGITWTQQTSNAGANNLNWLSWNATSATMWCCGAAGKLLSAPAPFTTWTSRTSNTSVALARVEQTPDGTTGAIAIGATGTLTYTTAPGTPATAWTQLIASTTGTAITFTGLALLNTVFLCATSNNTGIYSTNLTSWAKFGGASMGGACYGNSNYFAVGASGALGGSALNALTPYYDALAAGDATWNCCVYHTGNSIYIAAGAAGALSSFTTAFAATSRTSGFGANAINAGIYDPVSSTVGFVGAAGKVFWSLNGTTVYTAATGVQATALVAICTDASNAVNKFCAVGNSGVITTLTAAFVASATQTSGTTQNLAGVASNGAGTFCAVGANSSIGTSTNSGVTWAWQDYTTNGIGALQQFLSIIWDGTRFVAMSSSGAIFQSTAGTSWTLMSHIPTAGSCVQLIYANSTYVVTCSTGQILSSTDRVAWAIQRQRIAAGGIAEYLNGGWFIFGSTGYEYSTNGTSWKEYISATIGSSCQLSGHLSLGDSSGLVYNTTDGSSYTLAANQIAGNILGMASDGTNMIAVTATAVYRSTDNGVTWTQTASRPIIGTFTGMPCAIYTTDTFIITGQLGYAIKSTDGGATWSTITRAAHSVQSICWDATIAKVIALCTNGIILTADHTGSPWTVSKALLMAGNPISANAKICTNGAGGVKVLDTSAVYSTADAVSWKSGTCPAVGAAFILNLNGVYMVLGNPLSYTLDGSNWYYINNSPTISDAWATYFNSKYLIFGTNTISARS